jgi:hypothetical protein
MKRVLSKLQVHAERYNPNKIKDLAATLSNPEKIQKYLFRTLGEKSHLDVIVLLLIHLQTARVSTAFKLANIVVKWDPSESICIPKAEEKIDKNFALVDSKLVHCQIQLEQVKEVILSLRQFIYYFSCVVSFQLGTWNLLLRENIMNKASSMLFFHRLDNSHSFRVNLAMQFKL